MALPDEDPQFDEGFQVTSESYGAWCGGLHAARTEAGHLYEVPAEYRVSGRAGGIYGCRRCMVDLALEILRLENI